MLAGFLWIVEGTEINIGRSTFLLFILYAFIYETGYRGIYRRAGMKGYFFLVMLTPAIFSTAGYMAGIIVLINK